MKIAYISNSIIPSKAANSVHVMKMCQAFFQEGHKVKLIAGYRKGVVEENVKDIFAYYGINNRFELKILKRTKFEIYGQDILYSYRSRKIAKDEKADLVYGRNLLSCYLAAKAGLDVIFECHAFPKNRFNEILFKRLIKHKRCKALIVISKALKEILLRRYPDDMSNVKVIVAHDGVDIERFSKKMPKAEAREAIGLPKEKVIIGYVGHLYKGRGIDIILELAKLSKDQVFIVVGGTKESVENYKNEAAKNGISNLIFYGHIPNGELIKYFMACDVLLMPYQKVVNVAGNEGDTSKFMSPLKMFEYMASGVPFISSNLPVLSEVLVDKHNCMMVEPDDIQQWHEAKESIINDELITKKLSFNQIADVEKFSWRNRVKDILDQAF